MNLAKKLPVLFFICVLVSCDPNTSKKKSQCELGETSTACSESMPRENGPETKSPSEEVTSDYVIINPTKSRVIAHKTNKTMFYVLPPKKFKDIVTVSSIRALNANLGFCDQYPIYLESTRKINLETIKLLDLKGKSTQFDKDLEEITKSITPDLPSSNIRDLENKIENIKKAIESTKRDISTSESVLKSRNKYLLMHSSYLELEGGIVDLSLESSWDEDINIISVENRGLAFERAELKSKPAVQVRTILPENYPGIDMIKSLSEFLVLENIQGSTYISEIPGSLMHPSRVPLFLACPMLKNESGEKLEQSRDLKIEIEYTLAE